MTTLDPLALWGIQGMSQAQGLILIRSTPALLRALEGILASLSSQDEEGLMEHADEIVAARAAVAQARGLTAGTCETCAHYLVPHYQPPCVTCYDADGNATGREWQAMT